MPRFICLNIAKASAVVACLGIASSACYVREYDAHDGRRDHPEERHDHDDHHHDDQHHDEHR